MQSIFGIRLLVALLDIVSILMMVRAILSWLPLDEENRIEQFIVTITEPFIIPMRMLLDRFDAIRTIPVDIPFFATFILLFLVSSLLQTAI